MSYELSFSPEFFLAEGEPYDGGPEPSERPVSVWNALESMRTLDPGRWDALARDVFKCEGRLLNEETVLDMIRETNSCADLRSPVKVYIDPDFTYSVTVY